VYGSGSSSTKDFGGPSKPRLSTPLCFQPQRSPTQPHSVLHPVSALTKAKGCGIPSNKSSYRRTLICAVQIESYLIPHHLPEDYPPWLSLDPQPSKRLQKAAVCGIRSSRDLQRLNAILCARYVRPESIFSNQCAGSRGQHQIHLQSYCVRLKLLEINMI
jgi:hypothetical protein